MSPAEHLGPPRTVAEEVGNGEFDEVETGKRRHGGLTLQLDALTQHWNSLTLAPVPAQVKRNYGSPLREERARATRHRVREAATHLSVERGYVRTTVRDIAESAGVAPRTVHAAYPGPTYGQLPSASRTRDSSTRASMPTVRPMCCSPCADPTSTCCPRRARLGRAHRTGRGWKTPCAAPFPRKCRLPRPRLMGQPRPKASPLRLTPEWMRAGRWRGRC